MYWNSNAFSLETDKLYSCFKVNLSTKLVFLMLNASKIVLSAYLFLLKFNMQNQKHFKERIQVFGTLTWLRIWNGSMKVTF